VIVVRECAAQDLVSLERRMPTGGHDAHAFHHRAQSAGTSTYLTAWDGDVPVGTCVILLTGCFDAEVRRAMPEAFEVSQIHVHPDVRGRGIGTELIRCAERLIAARGGTTATMSVAQDNVRAAALYARLGYEDTGLRSTARYAFRDEAGVEHQLEEHNRTLAKPLAHGGSSPAARNARS
jgi:ribosomal protein S18 acetylase RimI-like enzyme